MNSGATGLYACGVQPKAAAGRELCVLRTTSRAGDEVWSSAEAVHFLAIGYSECLCGD